MLKNVDMFLFIYSRQSATLITSEAAAHVGIKVSEIKEEI